MRRSVGGKSPFRCAPGWRRTSSKSGVVRAGGAASVVMLPISSGPDTVNTSALELQFHYIRTGHEFGFIPVIGHQAQAEGKFPGPVFIATVKCSSCAGPSGTIKPSSSAFHVPFIAGGLFIRS